jgi:hypothetical protein
VRRPAAQPQRSAGQHGDRKYAFHIPPRLLIVLSS